MTVCLVGPFSRLAPLICITIKSSMYVWQLRATMSMLPHVKSVCKSAFYHLWNISRIRKLLSTKTAEILVHACVTSKLDHFNSLLYSVPKCVIKKLQSVQKAAARPITSSPILDRITLFYSNSTGFQFPSDLDSKYICSPTKSPIYIQGLIRRHSTLRCLNRVFD